MCLEFQTSGATLGGADSLAALGTLAAVKKCFELLPEIGEAWQYLPPVGKAMIWIMPCCSEGLA
jgi:hypothetical protein